jgi:hypothetical protein
MFELDLDQRQNCGGELKLSVAMQEPLVNERIVANLDCRCARSRSHLPKLEVAEADLGGLIARGDHIVTSDDRPLPSGSTPSHWPPLTAVEHQGRDVDVK